jgi:hypothetical protein
MATIRFEAVFSHFPSGPLVCALLVASGLVWTVMFFGPLAHLSRLAGGESPFDIRPMGYSYEEAASEAAVTTPIASCSSICSIRRFMRSRAAWRCGG